MALVVCWSVELSKDHSVCGQSAQVANPELHVFHVMSVQHKLLQLCSKYTLSIDG